MTRSEFFQADQRYGVDLAVALEMLQKTEKDMEGLRGNPPGVAYSKLLREATKKRASIPTAEDPVLNTGQ